MRSNQFQGLLQGFCSRYSLLPPDPDEKGRYRLGFDQVEVSLFEDLGRLYLLARLVEWPSDRGERDRLLEKIGAYLFKHLYMDECILNLIEEGETCYLALVVIVTELDAVELDGFDARLGALVNRAEGAVAHLEGSSAPAAPARLSVFRP